MILNVIGAAANLCKFVATLPSTLKFIATVIRRHEFVLVTDLENIRVEQK